MSAFCAPWKSCRRGPHAPWHANTGPHEPRHDDSAEARGCKKVGALKPFFSLPKTPGGVRGWTNTHETKDHLPRGSHDPFESIGRNPEACNSSGVIKGMKFKLRRTWIDPKKVGLIQVSSKFQQTFLDRSKESWIDPTLDETSPEQFGSIQTQVGSIQTSSDSQINSLYVHAINGKFLVLWELY